MGGRNPRLIYIIIQPELPTYRGGGCLTYPYRLLLTLWVPLVSRFAPLAVGAAGTVTLPMLNLPLSLLLAALACMSIVLKGTFQSQPLSQLSMYCLACLRFQMVVIRLYVAL